MNQTRLLTDITDSTHLLKEDQCTNNQFIERILKLFDAPRGAPAFLTVVSAATKSVMRLLECLPSANHHADDVKYKFSDLLDGVLSTQQDDQLDAPSALKGLKHKHPLWCLLADSRLQKNNLAQIYVGLQTLLALQRMKPVPLSASRHLSTMLGEDDVPSSSIEILLGGMAPDETVDAPWLHSLHKAWRDVVRHFSSAPPPPPSIRGRVVGELMSNVFSASSAHRAGATKHRNLSNEQTTRAYSVIARELDADSLSGALGVLVAITGFSIGVAAEIELLDSLIDGAWVAGVAINEGTIKIDFGMVINEPSQALPGSMPSSYMLVRPLPLKLVRNLKSRLDRYPAAKKLQDLYPEHAPPNSSARVYPCPDDIAPSWSRLRYSTGRALRQLGVDCLSSFITNCDLSHIPRSKLHYASLSAAEIHQAMSRLYAMTEWSEPASIPIGSIGFGCRAVPTHEALQRHDRHLVDLTNQYSPGNHAGLHRLLTFHNSFIRLSAWRLSVLLALRETATVDLPADIDENNDAWLALHDKVTPNDQGLQPVPLCKFATLTIRGVRAHCRIMLTRLSRQHTPSSDFARWCNSVANSSNIRLLCLATDTCKVVPVATHDFIRSFDSDYELAPDCSRKVMENFLRHAGLPSSHIDAVLRHSIRGQYRLSAFSNSCLDTWSSRTAKAMDAVATSVFGDVVFGLSKE
ncbi:MAG: hypothetical protein U1E12_22735 [Hydrogenophaga sp.]|uniref:hypothetical protein n=1 Tax=Hydrogenophaga sp. TaxID=1904254 RepID=UPI002719EA59|nr:hypothetical protein [Hydrogenophaga sp.]MDO9220954.1 hypothetical protein [Thiobacillus sp.]MDZ4104486.1 hypothetical protein [Hydrogenophaga sp.]